MGSRVDEPPQPTSRLDWQTAKMGFQEKDAWSDESGVEVEISHCGRCYGQPYCECVRVRAMLE